MECLMVAKIKSKEPFVNCEGSSCQTIAESEIPTSGYLNSRAAWEFGVCQGECSNLRPPRHNFIQL